MSQQVLLSLQRSPDGLSSSCPSIASTWLDVWVRCTSRVKSNNHWWDPCFCLLSEYLPSSTSSRNDPFIFSDGVRIVGASTQGITDLCLCRSCLIFLGVALIPFSSKYREFGTPFFLSLSLELRVGCSKLRLLGAYQMQSLQQQHFFYLAWPCLCSFATKTHWMRVPWEEDESPWFLWFFCLVICVPALFW